jgi:thymidine phosphorylase
LHAPFHAVDLIRTKRDGGELSGDQIDWAIAAYTAHEIAEEQMSALAMAVFFRGLNRRELNRWTQAMINSGERLDFSSLSKPTADKHSTAEGAENAENSYGGPHTTSSHRTIDTSGPFATTIFRMVFSAM